MPQDPRKRQKAAMKKRQKAKARKHAAPPRAGSASVAEQAIVRQARSFPIFECWISPGWQKREMGLVQILVARQQPNGNIAVAVYLVDIYCLGLKNVLYHANVPPEAFQAEFKPRIFHGERWETCPPELAHQMIYSAIEYAAQFGFKPQKDFEVAQYLLAPRGELAEPYDLSFGLNGKPFFVSGPYDDAHSIIAKLEKTAGPGNYDYLIGVGPNL